MHAEVEDPDGLELIVKQVVILRCGHGASVGHRSNIVLGIVVGEPFGIEEGSVQLFVEEDVVSGTDWERGHILGRGLVERAQEAWRAGTRVGVRLARHVPHRGGMRPPVYRDSPPLIGRRLDGSKVRSALR